MYISRYLDAAEPQADKQNDDVSLSSEMVGGLKRGLFVATPQMIGGAMKAFSPVDSDVYAKGADLQESAKVIAALPEMQKSATKRGIVGETLVSGAEGIGQMAPVIAGSLINPILGAGIAGGMYGGSTYQDTKERMLSQEGLDDTFAATDPDDPRVRKAKLTGAATGVVQGVADAAMSYLGGRFLKGAFPSIGKQTAEGVIRGIAQPGASTLKQFGKAWGTEMVGEGVTEALQDEGQAAIERAAGLKDAPAFGAQAAESARGGVGMAMLLGPLAGPGHYKAFRDAHQVQQALTDPAVDPSLRIKAALVMSNEIARVDETAARNFLDHAYDAIGDKKQTGSKPYALDLDNIALLQPFKAVQAPGSSSGETAPAPAGQEAAPVRQGAGISGTSILDDSNPQPTVKSAAELFTDNIPDFDSTALSNAGAGFKPVPTPPPAGALTRASAAGEIATVPQMETILEARPTASQDMQRGIAGNLPGPVIDAEYSEMYPALPAPPAEIERARAWATDQIRSGKTYLMQNRGVSDEQHAARILDEYRKAQGVTNNGNADILSDVQGQGPDNLERQGMGLSDLQTEVEGIGSDHRQSGGMKSGTGDQEPEAGIISPVPDTKSLQEIRETITSMKPGYVLEYLAKNPGTVQHLADAGVVKPADTLIKKTQQAIAWGKSVTNHLPDAGKMGSDQIAGAGNMIENKSPGTNLGAGFKPAPTTKPAPATRSTPRTLDTSKDSLLVAIAKLGGINRADIDKQMGNGKELARTLNTLAGKEAKTFLHVISTKGQPLDKMREALVEQGYLRPENNISDLLDRLDSSQRGTVHRSVQGDHEAAAEDAYDAEVHRLAEQYAELSTEEIAGAIEAVEAEAESIAEEPINQEVLNEALSFFDQFIEENSSEVATAETQAVPDGNAQDLQAEDQEKDGAADVGEIGENRKGEAKSDPQPRETAQVGAGLKPAPTIDQAAHEAATSPANETPEPTQAQIEAGNYKKGHIDFQGLDISIENPAGSVRKGVDPNGKQWETELHHHYGYIKGTVGRDKDHIDVFIGPDHDSDKVFVVDQIDPGSRRFDEHKAMLGFGSLAAARAGYLANYDKSGKSRIGAITEASLEEFKQWLKDGQTKKEFAPASVTSATSVPSASPIKSESKTKVVDAGEELTYNKRNRIRTGIKWADVQHKNDALKAREVQKGNVYPKPDYEALVADGMEPVVAHIVKQVYDSIAAKPAVRGIASDADFQTYIAAVNRVMDGVLKWANDKAAVAAWVGKQAKSAGAMLGRSTSLSDLSPATSLYDTVYPGGWREFAREVTILGGNKALKALQPGYSETARAFKDIGLGWPAKVEAWQRQGFKVVPAEGFAIKEVSQGGDRGSVFFVRKSTGSGHYQYLDAAHFYSRDEAQSFLDNLKPSLLFNKRNRMVDSFETKELATEAARNAVKKEGGGSTIEERGMNVADAERTGPEHREEGENVTSERLMDIIGFKGVNFGNWVPNDERQLHLNHAYDSFLDLAAALNQPPRALSLNGMLGLAIGAQGSGSHAAHFVPGVNEINITRTAGAGSVAHEWAHAVDHYFATQAGFAGAGAPWMTVLKRNGEKGDVRPEIVKAFSDIVQTMQKREATQEELAARAKATEDSSRKKLESWLKYFEKEFSSNESAAAELAVLTDRIRKGDYQSGEDAYVTIVPGRGRNLGTAVLSIVADVRDLAKKYKIRIPTDNIKALNSNVEFMKYLEEKKDDGHKPQLAMTRYQAAANKLDAERKSKKAYWSTPLEMFARAFDAYVSDKLEEKAQANTYLSHAGRSGDTVPMGEERKAINAAFDKLLDELKTRETEKGVALFKLVDRSSTGIQASEAQAWVSTLPISKRVNVVQSVEDLPAVARAEIEKARVNPTQVQAMELHGTIHVIADNVPDMRRVKALVIGHELAHAGQTEKIVNFAVDWFKRTKNGKTEQARTAHAMLERIAYRYGFDLDNEAHYRRAVQEATAAIAEQVADGKLPAAGLIQRLFMHIKYWLRKNGLISHVSDSELSLAVAEMLRIGEKRLSTGKGGEQAQMAVGDNGNANFALQDQAIAAHAATINQREFVVSPEGSIDFGSIGELNGRDGIVYPAAPVRLEKGGGYGHQHIAEKRIQEFKDNGYANEIEALYDIASNYTDVYEQPNRRLLLVKRDARGKYAAVELQRNGNYYGVTTWFMEDENPKSKTPYEERGGRKLLLHVAHADDSGQPSPFPVADINDQADKGRRSDQSNETIFTPTSDNVKANFALQDQAIAAHAATIKAPQKVADMTRSLFELIGQSIPERLKATIGKVLSNPWFGSEGKPIRRKVVDLNIERSQNRNGIMSDLFQASEGYSGVEGLDNILKNASKEERRQFNELIKYGDRNDIARTFTRDELYRGKTPFGKLSRTVVEAYKAFVEVMQAANRVRFQQLDELSMLPYKDQPWFEDLVELLNRNQKRMAGLSGAEAGEFHRLVRSLKRNLTDEQLASGDNPAKVKASPAVIAAYRDFWQQVDQVEKSHQGNMLSAFRDILGYRGELDKLKNEWGSLKGYAPRNRKDGDWHVSVFTTDDEGERVKVYMKPTLTETGAKSHVKEVQANLAKYLKSNFDPAAKYEVEYERNNATPSELLAWKGSEVAVEALLNQAFDRAGMTGKMSVEQWQSLKHEVFQEIAKEIMAQGFGRHGISREKTLIEGYDDTDYQTVLKEYISGMAGWLSKMRFAIETTTAAKDISKADPGDKVWVNDYIQDAMKNSTYMDELAATARSVGAVYYLGFKVSSAILNAFQNYTVGQAELSGMMKKAGHTGSAVAMLARAQKDVMQDWINQKRGGKGTLSAEEADVLQRAVREGTAQAQAVRMISGSQEMGFGTAWKKLVEKSMTPFSFVEQRLNREPAILAAYRVFKKTAAGDFDAAAYKRAEEFVNNTHYVMGKENLPEMVRKLGPLGKTAYLFQGYVHNYLHWMYNRAKQGEFETIARSLGAVAALGGVFALPGADDLDKWILKWFGVSYKMKFKKFMRDNAGDGTAGQLLQEFVNHGVTSVAGVDMSRALAVNIPFISDPDRSFGERVGGAWGGLLQKPGMAMAAAQKGDSLRAVENLMPEFIANPMRAMRQYNQGATTLSGKPIFDETGHQVKYGAGDVARKMLGFNPLEVSERTEMKGNERNLNAYWKDRRDDVLANIRRAETKAEINAATRAAREYNLSLRTSQAFPLVPIITADSIRRSRSYKPPKKTMAWERIQLD